MIQELIQDRLAKLSPDYQEVLKGNFTSEVVSRFGAVHNFTDWQLIVLENGFIGYLLFFMDQEEFTKFVSRECDMNLEDASVLVSSLISLMPDGYRESHEYTYSLFNGDINPNSISIATENNDANLANEIAETEAAINAVPQVRTMAGDMNAHQQQTATTNTATAQNIRQSNIDDPGAIHYPTAQAVPENLPTKPSNTDEPVYTTTQEAILRERAPQLIPQTKPTQSTNPNQTHEQTADPDEIRWGSAN